MTNRRAPAGRRPWFAIAAATGMAASALAADDPLLIESRAVAEEFGDRLRSALQSSMAQGGPAGAIDICKELAPQISSELSRRTGAQVRRTSLRLRNPRNLPADWQVEVLRNFEAGEASGSDTEREYFERRENGEVRYMKAIPTAGICIACHGTAVSEDVRQILAEQYPHDRAVGYEPGDVRGAFSIVWPADFSEQ
jgi:hypothetical protein